MVKSDLYRVFNVFLSNDRVTEEDFLNVNIGKNLISDFISEGVISKLGSYYILKRKCAGELSMYGDNLISKGNLLKGYKCYEFCVKLDFNSKARKKKFIIDVKRKDYEEALNYFGLETLNFKRIDSFYLFLLGLVYDLPLEYKDYVNRYRNEFFAGRLNFSKDELHKVIECSLKYRFNDALFYLRKLIREKGDNANFNICQEFILSSKRKFVNLDTILDYLNRGNLTIFNELLRDYLYDNNRGSYFILIKSLIKLSCMCGDNNFDLPISILENLSNESIEVDYDYYLSMFEDEFRKRSFQKANLILKILVELNKLGVGYVDLQKYALSLK